MRIEVSFIALIIFSICMMYIDCDTSSDDSSYVNPFHLKLVQVLEQISNKLQDIGNKMDGDRLKGVLLKELTDLKVENQKLKDDVAILNMNHEKLQEQQNITKNIQANNNRLQSAVLKELDEIKKDNQNLWYELKVVANNSRQEKQQWETMENEHSEKLSELLTLTNKLQINQKGHEEKLNSLRGNISSLYEFILDEETENNELTRNITDLRNEFESLEDVIMDNKKKIEDLANCTSTSNMCGGQSGNSSTAGYHKGPKTNHTPRDCGELKDSDISLHDGVYKIYPDRSEEVSVFCDMNDGGWTVFQRRMNGKTDFYRGWNEYRDGFGNPTEEYWLGNKYLHLLTRNRTCTLKIEMVNIKNISGHATYTNFQIASEVNNFQLRIGRYSGNAGRDSLRYHNNMEFTTKDRDHDTWPGGNCAVDYKGAWWYSYCYRSNLNGEYGRRDNKGVVWGGYPSSQYMKATTMKMKCK